MARDYFDSKGKLRGTSVSRRDSLTEKIQADVNSSAGILGFILVGGAFLLVAFPLIFLVVQVFTYLNEAGVHDLFNIIASVCTLALAIYCLVRFRLLRALYAIMIGVVISASIFYFATDLIWAGFFILIVMSTVIWMGHEIYKGRLFDI